MYTNTTYWGGGGGFYYGKWSSSPFFPTTLFLFWCSIMPLLHLHCFLCSSLGSSCAPCSLETRQNWKLGKGLLSFWLFWRIQTIEWKKKWIPIFLHWLFASGADSWWRERERDDPVGKDV